MIFLLTVVEKYDIFCINSIVIVSLSRVVEGEGPMKPGNPHAAKVLSPSGRLFCVDVSGR